MSLCSGSHCANRWWLFGWNAFEAVPHISAILAISSIVVLFVRAPKEHPGPGRRSCAAVQKSTGSQIMWLHNLTSPLQMYQDVDPLHSGVLVCQRWRRAIGVQAGDGITLSAD